MTRSPLRQLIRDVELPLAASYDPISKGYTPTTHTLPATFAVVWPNCQPCVFVEMYLLDLAPRLTVRRNDGGSLKTASAALSHLVRFCWERRKNFWDLDAADFYAFVRELQEERDADPGFVKRKSNTVQGIVENCIAFLVWLQTNVLHDRVIVGPREVNPQIRVIEKPFVDRRGARGSRYVYPFSPFADTPDPKRPISRELRNRLWDTVSDLYRTSRDYARSNIDTIRAEFLRARRELLLLLLEATGARPGELARLSVEENLDCFTRGVIVIPTLKRRGVVIPSRKIPIDKSVAIKIQVFIQKYRSTLLKALTSNGVCAKPKDRILIGCVKGSPIPEASLTKEFCRIVEKAGIEQRACMSMYRHRFITNMVRIHLEAFLSETPNRRRKLMTEADYRTILRRVCVFTGHKSEESLFHYIDWVWDEMGAFDYVEPALELVRALDAGVVAINSLRTDLSEKTKEREELIQSIDNELRSIRERTLAAINSAESHSRRKMAAEKGVNSTIPVAW